MSTAPPLSQPARDKTVDAAEAIRLIRSGDTVVVGGFAGCGFPEALTLALEQRFVETGAPQGLTLVFTVAAGDLQGRGLDRLAHPGLVRRTIGGHYAMSPAIQKLAVEGEVEAYNLPLGCMSHLFRDIAGNKPGTVSPVGLGTFVDPRNGGGKVNDRTTEDLVELVTLGGEEYLFYRAIELNVALLRATTADPDGNITMEREALTLEALPIATAVHNQRGLVIVQVERIAERGALRARDVKIPAALVDCVVVGPPENHWQTFGSTYQPAFSGELRIPTGSLASSPLNERKVIARRAAMELRPNSVVNLGVGIPEVVASVANDEHILQYLTLTAEPGVIGGMPMGGLNFGAAVNAQAIIDEPAQFDFYDGGGLDHAFLGLAQADAEGNVNVSRFGPRLAGAGGFINISQNARRLVFVGAFAAGGRSTIIDGQVRVDDQAATPKFVPEVDQITFSGRHAAEQGQPVLFVTERCVFKLCADGLQLIEIAPGIDVERDLLPQMGFRPIIPGEPAVMDARIFRPEPMGLKDDLLSVPLSSRFSYDEPDNLFFLNFEGLAVTTEAQLQNTYQEIDAYLSGIGRKVHVIVNYDNFYLAPHLMDAYVDALQALSDRYYAGVTRYTTSSFMRLKLGQALEGRDVAPYIYEGPTRR
jgi:propionate CoA-transferase